MRRIGFFLAAFSCLALLPHQSLCALTPSSTRQQQLHMQGGIDKLIALHAPHCHVGVEVVSLRSGLKLYQKNADHLFVPASALKMFTAAAALSTLGPDYTLTTTLWTDGHIEGETLVGNIYLKGGGDPELTSQDIEGLIETLDKLGIKKISGSLFVDNTDFDGVSQGPGWMWDDEPEYWNSPMDALTVNHSCVSLWVCPGAQCHDPAKVAMSPSIPFVKVRNFSSTKEGSATDLMISRKATSVCNVIDLGGVIEKSSEPKTLIVAISDPHLYAGHICLAYLKRHDIHIEKQSIATQKVPQNSQLLAEHVSRPVTLLIQKMMKESDNLYADCLFKKIGQERYGSIGSWKSGSQAVRSFLSSAADIDNSAMVVLDGSGLSRYNLVSPHQFVCFLQKMKTSPFYGDFLAALSLSGVDGTLKKALDEPELKGRVRAKSGGMKGVKTLCGYVKTKDGEPLAFSIMIGGFVEPRPKAHRLENEICKFLAGYEKNMAPCKE